MRISDWSSDVCSSDLKPLLGRWRWFAVTLCTTIATGILFWGVAEPLFHLNEPPKMLGLKPGSDAAATFAMSTMFLHWTLTPYAIYTVAALAFAIVYYNRREPFRLSSLFEPLLGRRAHGPVGSARSEEHTSELQSLMRISYAFLCL